MTKFCDEAVSVRTRDKRFLTRKHMMKEMDHFKKTGKHPALEQAAQAQTVPPLPEVDQNRPHVFMDFKSRGKPLGRLVVEVFEDQVPIAARWFLTRCREGMPDCFQGTRVHRLIPEQAFFAGLTPRYQPPGVPFKRSDKLHHVEEGCVSLSVSGAELAVTTARALELDSTHQVVGRVVRGQETLAALNQMDCDEHDAPLDTVRVSACGLTNATGAFETLDEAAEKARRNETPQQAAARLEAEAQLARDAVKDALETGLSSQKKAEVGAARAAPRKKSMLDDMLGDVSDTDSDEGG